MIARTCRLKGCGIIVHRLIDVRNMLVVIRSVALGDLLGSHGCRCRNRGVRLGLYSINVFVVWVECVKVLLVNVCYGTAKSAEIGPRACESPLDNTLKVPGGEFPFL